MSRMPLPVRVAAGLVATAAEQARDLPRTAVELPLTAVSQALQVSMRVQQKITELAIKGDKLLGGLRPVEERPSWATFDDEEPGHYDDSGPRPVTDLRPGRRPPRETTPPVTRRARASAESEPGAAADTAAAVAAETTAGAAEPGTAGLPPEPEEARPPATGVAAEKTAEAASGRAARAGESRPGGGGDESGPNVMPGYADLTIPQLRGRLRLLSLEELQALLHWEQAHENRPAFVTMLSNRIATVTEG